MERLFELMLRGGKGYQEERREESVQDVVGRTLSPLRAFAEEMDIHATEVGGEGWISPLKVLVADAERRMMLVAKTIDRDLGGVVLSGPEIGWDFYSSVPDRCEVKGSSDEHEFVCPCCLSKETPLTWDEMNDRYHCSDCGKSFGGVVGLVDQFAQVIRQSQ